MLSSYSFDRERAQTSISLRKFQRRDKRDPKLCCSILADYNIVFDVRANPMTVATTPKTLLTLSTVMLTLATVFGVLTTFRVSGLQTNLARTTAARDLIEQRRAALDRQNKAPETTATAPANAKKAEDGSAAKAEADLARVLQEKSDLQTKLKATEAEVASLRNQTQESSNETVGINPGAPSTAELQAQLDDTRRQLDNAERENGLLSEKLGGPQKFATTETNVIPRDRVISLPPSDTKRHDFKPAKPGLRGAVLAVNQAYNFVVLNVGERQGLRSKQDMLVLRDGALIGKIRISSVEPATAIGDIVTNSLARGVQVQPGDIVIYADTNR
jgi:hypothetical protein